MKYLITLVLIVQAVLLARSAFAQAIYGPSGNYLGYSQTAPSGVTNVFDNNGNRIGYSPAGVK
jgi:hypothetical protein